MKVLRYVRYLFLLPLYWLSCIIPKDKNLWVFGSWFGRKFADNSKYLFLYVRHSHPEIRAVWLSKNPKVIKELRENGYEAYKSYSLRGFLLSMRAGCVITCTGLGDVNRYVIGNAKKVQLWHGTPLKKIDYDDMIPARLQERKITKMKKIGRSLVSLL